MYDWYLDTNIGFTFAKIRTYVDAQLLPQYTSDLWNNDRRISMTNVVRSDGNNNPYLAVNMGGGYFAFRVRM
jgi:hypothetical protein